MAVIESFIKSLGSTAYPGPAVSYTSHQPVLNNSAFSFAFDGTLADLMSYFTT